MGLKQPDKQPIIDPVQSGHRKVYLTRWYVMAMVSLANILNNNQWAYWGPIAQSAKTVYGWTDNTIFILTNLGNGAAFFSTLVGCYFVDRKGIRISIVVCYSLMALSTASKVFTTDSYPATILIGCGQVFNGFATSVTGAIPPAVSEVWFPSKERTTATAIAALAAGFGAATSFIIGPLAVDMPIMNGTTTLLNQTDVSAIRLQISHLNYAEFGVSLALLLACLLYLPTKPPTPPSLTASCSRYDFKQGILTLIRRPKMLHIGLMYGVAVGSFGSWSSVFDIIVNPLGITQSEAGWMGFYGGVAGVLGGITMGRVADSFKRRMKLLLIILCVCAALLFGWFTCQCNDILPRSTAMLYIAAIGANVLITATMPIFIEIACETSYPIAEGLTAGVLSMVITLTATVYLLINLIPGIGNAWMNWWVTGVFLLVVPLIWIFKVTYQRVDIDSGLKEHPTDVN